MNILKSALNTVGSFFKNLAGGLTFLIGMALTVYAIYLIDTRVFPVMADYKVNVVPDLAHRAFVSTGQFRWKRDCTMEGLRVYGKGGSLDRSVVIVNMNRPELVHMAAADVSAGLLQFGPLPFPMVGNPTGADRIEIIGLFQCHPLWVHVQTLGVLDAHTFKQIQ